MSRAAIFVVLFAISVPARAEMPAMFQEEGTAFVAPNRIFSINIPPTWGAALVDGDPDTIQFRSTRLPGHGALYIRRVTVPTGAHPRQLLLNALEDRLSKLPGFRLAQKRDVRVAGHPAASVVGAYDFHGNAQYPRALEEIYVVAGTDAYIFHFECAEPVAGSYANDLTKLYTSFQPRAPATQTSPFAVDEETPVDDSELPF